MEKPRQLIIPDRAIRAIASITDLGLQENWQQELKHTLRDSSAARSPSPLTTDRQASDGPTRCATYITSRLPSFIFTVLPDNLTLAEPFFKLIAEDVISTTAAVVLLIFTPESDSCTFA